MDGKGRIKGGAGGKFNGRRFGAKWRFKKKSTPNTGMAAAKYDENDPNCGQAACDDSYLYGKDAYSMMEKVTMDPDSNILRVPHHGSTRAIKAIYKVSYALEKFKTPENAKKLDALKKQAWAGIQNANGYDSSDFEVALRIAIGKTNSAEIESRLDLIDDD